MQFGDYGLSHCMRGREKDSKKGVRGIDSGVRVAMPEIPPHTTVEKHCPMTFARSRKASRILFFG
jgi:hypothetical protein